MQKFRLISTVFLLSVFLAVSLSDATEKKHPVVRTEGGKVGGEVKETSEGKSYYSFQSIPFGKPPVGNLRFKKPEPANPWTGVRNGRSKIRPCTHYNEFLGLFFGQEDCLHLNVFTTLLPDSTTKDEDLLPVIVYIQGGVFQHAFADPHVFGVGKFIRHDVTMVQINYRLGVLGFLSTGDDEVPGNFGVYDMILALKWINRNIKQFGGDPSRVTLIGHSAGAISISMMLFVKDQVDGLFQRVIFQSGNLYFPVISQRKPKKAAERLAQQVGCPTTPTCEMIECLRKIPDIDLVESYHRFGGIVSKWGETADYNMVTTFNFPGEHKDIFLSLDPDKVFKQGNVYRVSIIVGSMANEAAFFFEVFSLNSRWRDRTKLVQIGLGELIKNETDYPQSEAVEQRLKQEYLGNLNPKTQTDTYYREAQMIISDFLMNAPNNKFVTLWSGLNIPTYRYVMTYRGRHSIVEIFNRHVPDASHGDEMLYLFENVYQGSNRLKGNDLLFSNRMLAYYVNFVKTGNPNNPPFDFTPVEWERFESSNGSYLEMGKEFVMKENYRTRPLFLWNNIIPKLGNGIELTEEEKVVSSYEIYLP